jgi:hypothetical protein
MLQIRTTGIEDFLDGSHNVKALIVGGPGAGKTRMSSYWNRPIYADCESGRASIADRNVAYVSVKGSKDMLDFLAYLKALESTPKSDRQYQTVVVDTLDGFQRTVKDEWLQRTNSGEFKGYDAWGFLDSKMNMLMTRLLNLDYNVLVLAHYKTSIVKDADGQESNATILQLDGNIKNTVFNDFDLVGRLGTYWEAQDGQRVERRGLTFQPTPEWPFLKDRLAATPRWMPISFCEDDYAQIFAALADRLTAAQMPQSEVVGEVPEAVETPAPTVVAPRSGGPVRPKAAPAAAAAAKPATAAKESSPPDAPAPPPDPQESLGDMSKQDLAARARALGHDVRGNALKAEIIALIESGAPPKPDPAPGPEPATAPAGPPAKPANCADCDKELAGQTPDYVKLSYIKYRRHLCDTCYQATKNTK